MGLRGFWGLGGAALTVALSLYAAIAGAQTNPAKPVAPSAGSSGLMVAQATSTDCDSFDTLGC